MSDDTRRCRIVHVDLAVPLMTVPREPDLVGMQLVFWLGGLPLAVRIVGSVHGLLFLLFMAALYRAGNERDWPLRRWLLAFGASIVPFGTFIFDRSLRREITGVTPSQ